MALIGAAQPQDEALDSILWPNPILHCTDLCHSAALWLLPCLPLDSALLLGLAHPTPRLLSPPLLRSQPVCLGKGRHTYGRSIQYPSCTRHKRSGEKRIPSTSNLASCKQQTRQFFLLSSSTVHLKFTPFRALK